MTTKYYIYIIFLFFVSCNSSKHVSNFKNNWVDIGIENIELPIHKMEGTNNSIWATDYGDGFLYRSVDEGNSWSKITQFGSEYIEAIQFIDDNTGFVCGDYGYVYKTTDQGKTWKDISPNIEGRMKVRYRNDSTKNQKPDGIFSAYYGMHFFNNNEGFVSGYSTYTCSIIERKIFVDSWKKRYDKTKKSKINN